MNVALRIPTMTREQFLDWAEAQNQRYEFDGFAPVAMVGGTANHSLICQNVYYALRSRLGRGPCRVLGADAGVATVGDAVRFPDAVVTCASFAGTDRLVPDAVVIFEVLSPSSGRNDRIDKLREYRAIPSMRRYVILEHTSPALTLYHRADGEAAWTALPHTVADTLPLPEIGAEIPVREFYDGTDLLDDAMPP